MNPDHEDELIKKISNVSTYLYADEIEQLTGTDHKKFDQLLKIYDTQHYVTSFGTKMLTYTETVNMTKEEKLEYVKNTCVLVDGLLPA